MQRDMIPTSVSKERSHGRSFFVFRTAWRRRITGLAGVLLLTAGWAWAQTPRKAPAPFDPVTAWRELRKRSLVALVTPWREAGPDAEQRRFIKAANDYLAALKDTSPRYRLAALYLRGRYYAHTRKLAAARADYDEVIKGLPAKTDEAEPWPPGMPNRTTVLVFRAMTFVDDGAEAILKELSAIPADAEPPLAHELSESVYGWAEELERANKFGPAIQAYEIIRRFHLWEGESENPQPRIELLRIQAKNQGQSL